MFDPLPKVARSSTTGKLEVKPVVELRATTSQAEWRITDTISLDLIFDKFMPGGHSEVEPPDPFRTQT